MEQVFLCVVRIWGVEKNTGWGYNVNKRGYVWGQVPKQVKKLKVESKKGNMRYQNIYNRIKRIEGQVRAISEMLAAQKPEQDILIQLEAARSSLGSSITALIELMITTEREGKVELSKDQLRAILRAVKK